MFVLLWTSISLTHLVSFVPFDAGSVGSELLRESIFAIDTQTLPGAGSSVLRPLGDAIQCNPVGSHKKNNFLASGRNHHAHIQGNREALRGKFGCAAGCSRREPELERVLAPWAEWSKPNSTGLDMLDMMWDFCHAHRSCKDPFVMAVLWNGDVHLRACRANSLFEPALYLIGPEDLSLVIAMLLAVQRVAVLPPGPTVLALYLSDYSCLADRHLIGPGLPIFAYLRRETSWLIPWPSSFTLHSTMQVEDSRTGLSGNISDQSAWSSRVGRAYWIGTVTGPWELVPDAVLTALPRLQLLKLASQHPKHLQVEWSGAATYGISWIADSSSVQGFYSNSSQKVRDLTGIKRSVYKRLNNFSKFKYYINVDGVVMGGRFNKLLAMGGVVLQQDAGYYEHLNALARPYEHYVPIRYDLSDLVAKIEWLQEHDDVAQRIAKQGQELALGRMRLEDDLCYVWRALEAITSRTAPRSVTDPLAVDERLAALRFTKVSLQNASIRDTLQAFWGARLEDVKTGSRQMTSTGINLVQWAWDRFEAVGRKALV